MATSVAWLLLHCVP